MSEKRCNKGKVYMYEKERTKERKKRKKNK